MRAMRAVHMLRNWLRNEAGHNKCQPLLLVAGPGQSLGLTALCHLNSSCVDGACGPQQQASARQAHEIMCPAAQWAMGQLWSSS